MMDACSLAYMYMSIYGIIAHIASMKSQFVAQFAGHEPGVYSYV